MSRVFSYFLKTFVTLFEEYKGAEDMEEGQVLHTSPYAAQIDRFADSLRQLSQVFSRMDEKKTHFTEEEIDRMFQKIRKGVCKKCENCTSCWEEEFEHTYQMGYEILSAVDRYGNGLNTETKRKLQQNCIRPTQFLKEILELFHEARQNLIWNNRMCRIERAVRFKWIYLRKYYIEHQKIWKIVL